MNLVTPGFNETPLTLSSPIVKDFDPTLYVVFNGEKIGRVRVFTLYFTVHIFQILVKNREKRNGEPKIGVSLRGTIT